MDNQRQQVAERVKQATNILVTVSTNPSVDQLAACIGLTLALNKIGKHATAVFSGNIPSTIEFLQPEKTIEKNTDSLRDFIIALDKAKADKLRYKVEDKVVKIFITPYRTSISDKDLEFSQGDFNVDVVIALGVHAQSDLDQAITSHGRILHDATVVTMNLRPGGEFGSLNWLDPNSSSLSELTVQLVDTLDKKVVDGQIATAFLTGIVAETERFSNAKTTPRTMSISAELMSVGANQQLVATKLEESVTSPPSVAGPIARQDPHEGDDATDLPPEPPKKPDDGTLEISHDEAPVSEPAASETELTDESNRQTEEPEETSTPDANPESTVPLEGTKNEEEPALAQDKEEHPKIHDVKSGGEDAEPHEAKKKLADKKESADLAALLPEPDESENESLPVVSQAEPFTPEVIAPPPQIRIDDQGVINQPAFAQEKPEEALESLLPPKPDDSPVISHHNEPPKMVMEPPVMGGQLSANAAPEGSGVANEGVVSGLPGVPVEEPPLLGQQGIQPDIKGENSLGLPSPQETLSEIERDVHSPHVAAMMPSSPAKAPQYETAQPLPRSPLTSSSPPVPTPDVPVVKPDDMPTEENEPVSGFTDINSARDAVEQAINASATPALDPIEALNANPMGAAVAGGQASPGVLPAEPSMDTVDAPAPNSEQYGPDLNAPAVQPWTPPADTPPPFPPVMPGAPNPATQFDPAAFGQPSLPMSQMNGYSGQPAPAAVPPATPPPIAPQR